LSSLFAFLRVPSRFTKIGGGECTVLIPHLSGKITQ
jgi:hypothetical protein